MKCVALSATSLTCAHDERRCATCYLDPMSSSTICCTLQRYDPLTQKSSSGVVIAPSTSVLAPLIRGEPDMVGLLLGSRELLCLFGRISGTLVCCSSLSELCLPRDSASCQMQGESAGWWSNTTFIASQDGDFFQRGSARHVDVASFRGRHVKSAAYRYRGSTRHVVAT